MSLRSVKSNTLLLLTAVCVGISGLAQGQAQPVPKADVFVGYQWLNPGGTVPAPSQSPTRPFPMKWNSIPQGVGTAVTYNFSRDGRLEADNARNAHERGNE